MVYEWKTIVVTDELKDYYGPNRSNVKEYVDLIIGGLKKYYGCNKKVAFSVFAFWNGIDEFQDNLAMLKMTGTVPELNYKRLMRNASTIYVRRQAYFVDGDLVIGVMGLGADGRGVSSKDAAGIKKAIVAALEHARRAYNARRTVQEHKFEQYPYEKVGKELLRKIACIERYACFAVAYHEIQSFEVKTELRDADDELDLKHVSRILINKHTDETPEFADAVGYWQDPKTGVNYCFEITVQADYRKVKAFAETLQENLEEMGCVKTTSKAFV